MAMEMWNARSYAENPPFVPALGQDALLLLNAQAGEKILDLGCGDGTLTEKIAAMGAEVIGVDSSSDMIEAAKRRGLCVQVMDAYQLCFIGKFDAVFSNAALHWMKKDPDAVIAGVRRSLKTGGRFVGEMGGHGNVAAITTALVAVLNRHGIENADSCIPWYYPSIDGYREKLERGGFEVDQIALIPRPTPLPTGMSGWLRTFADPFLKVVAETEQETVLQETERLLRPVLCDEKGQWTADYVRLRFRAKAV